jgi:exopolyphosphatase/guanosine-5'-triphosphate,3'-diphosphate pyrophosphatase
MTRVAAVDCGTNSTRLLVSDDGKTVERLMRITRLGQGVDQTHALAPDAIERTVAVLREYRGVLDKLGVGSIRMTATSAARDAVNREEFFAAATSAIGVRPELLSGEEEGRISFAGAAADLDPEAGPYLIVDIGGGSTELAVGPRTPDEPLVPIGAVSVDIGCVRLTEKYFHHDPPKPEELSQVVSVVRDYLDDVVRDLPEVVTAQRLVGLAGTVTTMAAVEIGLASYDRDRIHHFALTRAAAEDVFRTLASESRRDRVFNPGLEEERADVIVAGCLILVTIMRKFGFDDCLVSEADILDGLAMSLLGAGR